MIQICYDDNGLVLFTVNGNDIPPGMDGNWLAYEGPKLGSLTGWRVIDGAMVLIDLGPARAAGVSQINGLVGQFRLAYITDIPGQQAIYAEKADEARAYVALPVAPLTLTDFPMLKAEIGITAPDAWQLSQVWLYMAALWKQVAADSETQRTGTIDRINAALTLAKIDAILEEFPLK